MTQRMTPHMHTPTPTQIDTCTHVHTREHAHTHMYTHTIILSELWSHVHFCSSSFPFNVIPHIAVIYKCPNLKQQPLYSGTVGDGSGIGTGHSRVACLCSVMSRAAAGKAWLAKGNSSSRGWGLLSSGGPAPASLAPGLGSLPGWAQLGLSGWALTCGFSGELGLLTAWCECIQILNVPRQSRKTSLSLFRHGLGNHMTSTYCSS